MSDGTKIEWTDATWNPITGCSVVSSGCKNCYAMKLAGTRLQHHPSRAGLTVETKSGSVWTGEVRLNEQWLDQPIRWSRQRMVFVCAHADLFHPAVPDAWIDAVFGVMWACEYGRNEQPGHVFQVLTKRPERMRDYLATDRRTTWAHHAIHYGGGADPDGLYDQVAGAKGPHPRIWIGVSVEDQAAADERIPLLLQTPAAVRWISAEPLLGEVRLDDVQVSHGEFQNCLSLEEWADTPDAPEVIASIGSGALIDWVVVGGESGPKARPMSPDWARSLRDQCAAAGVPFLFKQWGEWLPDGQIAGGPPPNIMHGSYPWGEGGHFMIRSGKKAAGRLLDGVQHDGYPKGGAA